MNNGTGVPGHDQDIAVVGLSLRLPGSRTPDEFWDHLAHGRSLITEVPERRRRQEDGPGHRLPESDGTGSVWGGFLDDADCFDAGFFWIPPREARSMDPQQRMALELSWHALEDAGYRADRMTGSRTGVFMGVRRGDYAELTEREADETGACLPAGAAHAAVADRVSYQFGFHGPSVVNDTACAGSLVAVEQAVQALRRGDCDHALAGGVNVSSSPRHFIAFANAGMVSPDGRYRAFDAHANGYVRGEGGGVLLLKRAADARRDGDAVHALIKGIGSSHGARTSSLTVTDPAAQAELIAGIHRRAGIAPETVTYVETHGPGTPDGDPIEIRGLKQAFADLHENRPETGADRPGAGKRLPGTAKGLPGAGVGLPGAAKGPRGTGKGRTERGRGRPGAAQGHRCGVGSVKTGIGHLEGAAGIAGMLKVILAMRHRKLPATVGFEELHPLIKLDGSPLYIVDRLTDWTAGAPGSAAGAAAPLRAGVSSFGFDGTNAHVLLESGDPVAPAGAEHGEQWLPVSAKDEDRLRETCAGLARWARTRIRHNDAPALADVARTLRQGRVPMRERVVFRAGSLAEWAAQLESVAAGEKPPAGWLRGRARAKNPGGLGADDPAARAARCVEDGRPGEFAAAWVRNLCVDWAQWPEHGRRVHLPGYAFARTPHRFAPAAGPEAGAPEAAPDVLRAPLGAGFRDADGGSGRRSPAAAVISSALNGSEAHTAPGPAMWAWLRPADGDGAEWSVVAPGAPDSPAHAPLAALLKTAHQETAPSNTGKLVLLGCCERDGRAGEPAHDRDGRRRRRTTAEPPPAAGGESLLRDGGIYWITGDADGLGLLLAERLCERHRATVVVGGRPPHSPVVDALQVRLPHGEVTYRPTDVTDGEAVHAAVSDIRMQYGRLDGVFHAADALDAGRLAGRPLASTGAGLAPTVDGAAHVDAATRGLGLDFLLLFGSVAGAVGNAAHDDHATAHTNAFLDACAARRRASAA
ncbi:SDR family NAD(P)-dependent oxidoreductase [Streptomyces roseoverticillatus]|uniref:SDR family NAD(P)-dependent oxidoreductase n=1 Tax=Streptomyces roseoverticillatus TaxID=66429 RepID=UPI001F46866C|nr:SDR family NAD(P)-dependent oxidoreductase [Streptomyces roseoverticillatus]MCF3106171.1 SDR family NAD(P)-dependent oxidoreductase [Streptomyces roseoverticillatus]